ncbi:MAG: hypothetical protein HQK81_08545 [Desulfovibrionaceae bacterium]|nr:hypothetical protein [Desulfovibrionaceae bacterium]MBF0514098.1 hypothetical protein [Desulfovibrionaceae bacterium]
MPVLIGGSVLTCVAFLIHLAIWRVRLPRRQTRCLVRIFMGVAAAGLTLRQPLSRLVPALAPWLPATLPQALHVLLFVAAMMSAYVISYSALEADSPTLVMVRHILAAGPGGIAPEVFFREMNDEVLVQPRLDDLLRDGLAELVDGRYRPTAKGRAMARLFTLFRAVLGAGKGG